MISKWTQHLKDPIEIERFEQDVLNSRRVLERLRDILDEEDAELEDKEFSFKAFDLPNWELKQAAIIGHKARSRSTKLLLDLGDEPNDRKLARPK